jgi:hypothetical protein
MAPVANVANRMRPSAGSPNTLGGAGDGGGEDGCGEGRRRRRGGWGRCQWGWYSWRWQQRGVGGGLTQRKDQGGSYGACVPAEAEAPQQPRHEQT